MKVGKYEFDTQEEFNAAKENVDENLNIISFIGVIDDVLKVDVLWNDDITEQPEKWLPFAIDIEDEGIHFFHDYPYLENKFE